MSEYAHTWWDHWLIGHCLLECGARQLERHATQIAAEIVSEATGETEPKDPDEGKDPAAVALGRKGGKKGGKARAEKMTPEERSEAARKAAEVRWAKDTDENP